MKRASIVRYRNRPVKKHRSSRSRGVPLALIAGLTPGLLYAYNGFRSTGLNGAVGALAVTYTGFDISTRQWSPSAMMSGWLPILGGVMVHKIIGGMLGVNRLLARSRIPWIRL